MGHLQGWCVPNWALPKAQEVELCQEAPGCPAGAVPALTPTWIPSFPAPFPSPKRSHQRNGIPARPARGEGHTVPPRALVQDKDFHPFFLKKIKKISPNNRRMGRDWDGAKGHPKPSPTQGYGHGWALNIHSVRVSSGESGLGVSGLALPQVRMLQLKPQDWQGEGGDGSCAKPSLLGREKSQRIWGADPLHVHPGPAVIEWDPSSHIQHLHGPAQCHISHRRCPGKAAVLVPTPSSPSLPGARGSHSGQVPPSFCPCQGVFLPSLATGAGQGKRECQHRGGIAARLARANPPSIHIRPPSSFTSCLGPWEKEERDEQELGLCQGGQHGEKHMKTTGKNTMYIKKGPVMD